MDNTNEDINVAEVMKKSLEYYEYIDVMGEKISNIIITQIEPLLKEGKFEEAKKAVRDFYKPSRLNNSTEGPGDVMFIEYDMILASINRKIRDKK